MLHVAIEQVQPGDILVLALDRASETQQQLILTRLDDLGRDGDVVTREAFAFRHAHERLRLPVHVELEILCADRLHAEAYGYGPFGRQRQIDNKERQHDIYKRVAAVYIHSNASQ